MQNDDVVTMRKPVSGLFLLDSADRNLTGASSFLDVESQPWNNFRITKPQPLVDGFAKNLAVTEVYFPWCIPNITPRNNTFYMQFVTDTIYTVTIPTGFYTGASLALEVQAAISELVAPFVGEPPYIGVSYNEASRTFTFTPRNGNTFILWYSLAPTLDLVNYTQNPSLLKTMGFNPAQFGRIISNPNGITGSPTFIRYTNYVDIVSNRLHYDNEIKDGDSSQKTIRDVLCRIYCANEVSTYSVSEVGTAPFVIHRQFMTPKYIKLNPRQFFNAIDIQVYDQYGELVWTPPTLVSPPEATQTYQDFVITMITSEQ